MTSDVLVKFDIDSANLDELRALAARMEAAAAQLPPALEEGECVTATLQSTAPEGPGASLLVTAALCGAAFATNGARQFTRRDFLGFGLFRKRDRHE